MRCYVFDLDGTLTDLSHRLHHIEGEPKDWRAFFAAVGGDAVIEPLADMAYDLSQSTEIVIMSGRSDECRGATLDWLRDNRIIYQKLYMRKAGDHRPDDIVKKELLQQLLVDGYEPVLFVDDRKRVVDMWRAEGYTCLHCAPGEF